MFNNWFRGKPKPETRSGDYTDRLTESLLDAANDTAADGYVAALEVAAGALSRAFMAAEVSGQGGNVFNPHIMGRIARTLIECGEFLGEVEAGAMLEPTTYDIQPNGDYRVTYQQRGRDGETRIIPRSACFHVRYNVELQTQRGIAPLSNARQLKRLVQRIEQASALEASADVGYLIPTPKMSTDQQDAIRREMKNLKGRISLVETMAAGFDQGRPSAPYGDWRQQRFGVAIPESNMMAQQQGFYQVLSCCGYPAALARSDTGDTGRREAWRQYLHGTIAPLGRLVALEASRIHWPITIDWQPLFASDISGRARAFQSMVKAGMSPADAMAKAGLMND